MNANFTDDVACRIQICFVDAAGNETIEEFTDFYVTTNLFIRYFNNKPLFYGSIGGVAAVALAAVFLTKNHTAAATTGVGVGRKKKED